MGLMVEERADRARMCGARERCAGARVLVGSWSVRWNTLPSQRDINTPSGKFSCELFQTSRKIGITSRRAAICGKKTSTVRKNIIGHSRRAFRRSLAGGDSLLGLRRALTVLHQSAGKHGRSILLEPLVEKRGDLLAEIGGMAEARELIALQRSARSREKEFPRGLGLLAVHAALLRTACVKKHISNTSHE
jgi:ribosomal protein S14